MTSSTLAFEPVPYKKTYYSLVEKEKEDQWTYLMTVKIIQVYIMYVRGYIIPPEEMWLLFKEPTKIQYTPEFRKKFKEYAEKHEYIRPSLTKEYLHTNKKDKALVFYSHKTPEQKSISTIVQIEYEKMIEKGTFTEAMFIAQGKLAPSSKVDGDFIEQTEIPNASGKMTKSQLFYDEELLVNPKFHLDAPREFRVLTDTESKRLLESLNLTPQEKSKLPSILSDDTMIKFLGIPPQKIVKVVSTEVTSTLSNTHVTFRNVTTGKRT